MLTSGGVWCYGAGVAVGVLTPTGIPNNWPPLRQTGRIAQFNYQTGLAVSNYGNLMYVADTSQNLIRQIYCGAGTLFIKGTTTTHYLYLTQATI
jgi:hypothetical protein